MKRSLRAFLRSTAGLLVIPLVISLGCAVAWYQVASADSGSGDPLNDICSTGLLSVDSSDACGVDIAPEAPVHSNLEVGVLTAVAAILVVLLVILLSRRYFAGTARKRPVRRLLYAVAFSVVLAVVANLLLPYCLYGVVSDNSISRGSGVMLLLLGLVPSFTVLVVCLLRSVQNKRRRKLSVALLLPIVVVALLAYNAAGYIR